MARRVPRRLCDRRANCQLRPRRRDDPRSVRGQPASAARARRARSVPARPSDTRRRSAGGWSAGVPVQRQVDGALLDRPPREQADRDLLRHLDRPALPDPGDLCEVLLDVGRQQFAPGPGGRSRRSPRPAGRWPCRRRRSAAPRSRPCSPRPGSAPAPWSPGAARRRWNRPPPRRRSPRCRPRRARPARRAASRTGRCPPSARQRSRCRPASRRSSASCAGIELGAGQRLHRGQLGVAARFGAPTARSCRAAETSGQPVSRRPRRVGVGTDSDL